MVLGFSMSSLFYSVLKIPFTLIRGPDALFIQAMTFYTIMALNQFFSGVFYDIMIKSEYYKYHNEKAQSRLESESQSQRLDRTMSFRKFLVQVRDIIKQAWLISICLVVSLSATFAVIPTTFT